MRNEIGITVTRMGLAAGLVLVAVLCAATGRAEAQEYCVTCTGPTAMYRCIIEGARPGRQSLQMLCVNTMAKQGGHASCAIKGGTVFECDGHIRRVQWSAPDGSPQTGSAPAAAGQPGAAAKPGQAKAPSNEPPKTMLDLAKQANENMKKANEDAQEKTKSTNQAIGAATKKTWDCMISLFTRCGEQ